MSSRAPHLAQFLCLCRGPFLRPGLRMSRGAARKGRSRPAVALTSRLALRLPGRALTAPSTARGSSGSDNRIDGPSHFEVAPLGQHRPGDTGKLVGERNREHVAV